MIALLLLSILLKCSVSILGGFYNKKIKGLKNASPLYTFLRCAAAFLFWLIYFAFDGFRADLHVLPYSLLFGFFYFSATYFFVCALKTGSNAISTLFLNASSILVSVWGILFWEEPVSLLTVVGFILTLIAFVLCLFKGREKKKVNALWLFFSAATFFSNAGCSIVLSEQKTAFLGEYSPFFMMTSIAICTLISATVFLLGDKTDARALLRRAWYFPAIDGLSNGLMNLLTIALLGLLSTNILFPVRSISGLMLVTLFSTLIFKEKMRWWQWIGIAVGIAAVGILSV